MDHALDIALTVNGTEVRRRVEPRQHLVDFLREELGLTGTHTGCEHGVCGACTLRVDGQIVRGCGGGHSRCAAMSSAIVDRSNGTRPRITSYATQPSA